LTFFGFRNEKWLREDRKIEVVLRNEFYPRIKIKISGVAGWGIGLGFRRVDMSLLHFCLSTFYLCFVLSDKSHL